MTSGDLNIDVSKKIDCCTFLMIFDELLIAFYRFALRGLGPELEGGGGSREPLPPSGRGKSRGPSGCGLKRQAQGPRLGQGNGRTLRWRRIININLMH